MLRLAIIVLFAVQYVRLRDIVLLVPEQIVHLAIDLELLQLVERGDFLKLGVECAGKDNVRIRVMICE